MGRGSVARVAHANLFKKRHRFGLFPNIKQKIFSSLMKHVCFRHMQSFSGFDKI